MSRVNRRIPIQGDAKKIFRENFSEDGRCIIRSSSRNRYSISRIIRFPKK